MKLCVCAKLGGDLSNKQWIQESSLSTTTATELEKTPSHSSYPSPSPSHVNEVSDSPLHNEESPSPKNSDMSFSYMRTAKTEAVTIRVNTNDGVRGYVEDEALETAIPPPPPPPPFFESGTWDYFDTSDQCDSFSFVGMNDGFQSESEEVLQSKNGGVIDNVIERKGKWANVGSDSTSEYGEASVRPESGLKDFEMAKSSVARQDASDRTVECSVSNGNPVNSWGVQVRPGHVERNANVGNVALEQSSSKREKTVGEKDVCAEREDPSEFITHRAKDFLSSIKDIEHRFFRASESGREVSRMLESNKIRVGFSEIKGSSSASDVLAAFQLVCCRGRAAPVSHEPVRHVTKVITWKRTTSSRSSSSRNPLAGAARDDVSDSGSDFVEEFCMIAGSHLSTLERLFAWERKLYDEVKACESLRKEYDRKCNQLRHQFAKDHSSQVIDKTRAIVKDLHSQIRVGLRSVDSISRRIEKMRDEELHPQLVELIQGMTRMWKAMLECHHAQYITISLAYHSRSSTGTPQGNTRKQILAQLLEEVECFGLSFADWFNSLASYVESINAWLQNCILQPRERCKNRRPFSPRRVVAPPIFVLCRDWSVGIKALPSVELSNDIKSFLSDLRHLMEQQAEQQLEKLKLTDANKAEPEGKDDEKNDDVSSNLSCIHAGLTKVLDRLNKFSEASVKMYEDVKQKSEAARVTYAKCKPPGV
ncbi:protein ROLLING AND ERECT LEAF 2 isoform X2 [Citrus sinensis]|uniref:protein ROLLING AND ERECT LEAF 2 isoform X2 n=1 Tax=Citrus sinensis TaxID=2711 RepID=UPI0003D745B0|nr:protein ROLLING AND ERECT LEAF 2 isoform X2 [Citrus sinensis]